MVKNPFKRSPPEETRSLASRMAILQSLVPIATLRAGEQVADFSLELSAALLNLSEHTVRPAEATLSLQAYNDLKTSRTQFQRAVSDCLHDILFAEIHLIESRGKTQFGADDLDLSLVTFEEMENKVLLGNISQALERGEIAEALDALNLRIGRLLGREEFGTAENPFGPHVFVKAIYAAWCQVDPVVESRRMVLHMLGPELFLPLAPLLQELNDILIDQGILPDLTDAYRLKKAQNKVGLPPPKGARSEQARYDKVRRKLLGAAAGKEGGAGEDDLNVPDLFSAASTGGSWNANTISVKVGPRLFGYLSNLQKQIDEMEAKGESLVIPESATALRQVKEQAPPGALTAIDENTIELLAKIFDYLFQEQAIPPDMKRLIGQLQIPLLKAALIDKKFFVTDDHPARRLIDALAKTSVTWDQQKGHDDPLYKMIEQIIARVQKEFDQQMGLFTDVVANLETFLAEEEKSSETTLVGPIAEALRQEKMHHAREAAERDIAARIESGEVAGFVEIFLETQWTRILTLAYSVEEQKPEVLVKAIKAMDDLIWSVKPKNSPELRKELITKLPSILSLLNAWLNAIKWDEPARVTFFSSLAERHATIVRVQPELSSRHKIETAVNAAEKASARKMKREDNPQQEKLRDRFVDMVDVMMPGEWLDFSRNNGALVKFRLAWISPKRSRFIFTNRQGTEPFAFTAEELAQTLREHKASRIRPDASVLERALAAALDDAE